MVDGATAGGTPWGFLEGTTSGAQALDAPIPAVVRDLAAGRSLRPVWLNALGGLTCEVGEGVDRCFVKWTPPGAGPSAQDEAARMSWLARFSQVPAVIDVIHDPDTPASVLVTAPLAGESAVADRWKADPATAVATIGRGLRQLHDRAPVEHCPFEWSAQARIRSAYDRVGRGETTPADWHPAHQHLTAGHALDILDRPPPLSHPVVCHGDSCAPNTIIDDGRWSGHIDLGEAGIADRWADLAVATWSTEWNYGPGWDRVLLDAYGIELDPVRMAYYRLLWDLA